MRKMIIVFVLALGATAQDTREGRLVVHEWGTFTSIAGDDGAALEWRPLSGSSDLPSFVYQIGGAPKGLRHGAKCKDCSHFDCSCGDKCHPEKGGECRCCKTCMEATVRMETPVLYFYSDREQTVSVKVDFPKGRITEWYPQAREVGTGINWGGIKVRPGAKAEFPVEKTGSHYYPARETDAAPIQVCGSAGEEHEKFLFYRGVGTFDLPLRATLSGDAVTLESSDEISCCILFERCGKELNYSVRRGLRGKVTIDRRKPDGRAGALEEELSKVLVEQGLYEKEARAMIKTWRDTWFENGLRVFYIVPRKMTDRVLPITIDPKPADLVRVLVGRVEIITPEMEKQIRAQAEKLGDTSVDVREEATRALAKYGRFAQPVLKKILASSHDPEVRARIESLLGK